MDEAAYLSALRRDSAAMADAAEGNLDARVPGCPDWDVRELVVHTGRVHRFWHQIAERGLQAPEVARGATLPPDCDDDALLDWFREGAHALADLLQEVPGDRKVWTWAEADDAGFIKRRMAQETAVHRYDAEQGAVAAQPIETQLAADGVDEFVEHMMAAQRRYGEDLTGAGETVHLHQSDGNGGWGFTLSPDGVKATKGHPACDSEGKGTASDLLLVLWRRLPVHTLEIVGDREPLERLVAWPKLD
jgi:uncharacterized protein (TIGR03083 family)